MKVLTYSARVHDQEFFNQANQGVHQIDYTEARLEKQTAILARDYPAICCFVQDDLSAPVLERLRRGDTRLITLRATGFNNVDIEAASRLNFTVMRVTSYSPYSVAEFAVGLVLALNRKIHRAYLRVRDGNFSINGLLGFDMHGKTAGVVGTGKIGRCLISILKGFGMKVLAHDPRPDQEYAQETGISYTSLENIYKESDIISLHCPLSRETEYMISAAAIQQMKTGVMLINTSRGKLVDTHALINGLKSGKIGSAGLDVYEEESEYFFEDKSLELIADDILARLLTFSNVLMTSHQAFFTNEALRNIAQTTLNNFKEFFDGGYLKNEICYQCDKTCRKKENKRCF